MRKQLGVIFLVTLFLLSVPMFVNADPLTIHEEPIYSKSVKEDDESLSRIIKGKDVDLSFLAEDKMRLNEKQYLEKWNKHNPDHQVSNVKIVGDNEESESNSFSPSVVIGPDGRAKVSNINVTPYKQTLYLESIYINTFNDLVVYRCSGSFFKDNYGQGKVLTAAHCIYTRDMDENFVQGYAAGMAIFRGMKDGVYDDVSYASSVKIPYEYVDSGYIATDIGTITIQDDLSIGVEL